MDQLLPLVVRSNASPNSWLVVVVLPAGAFFWLVTIFHGSALVVLMVPGGLPVSWPIRRVSTACAIVSSRCVR